MGIILERAICEMQNGASPKHAHPTWTVARQDFSTINIVFLYISACDFTMVSISHNLKQTNNQTHKI